MRKVLITGGSGLVGKSIQTLVSNYYKDEYEYIFLSSSECDLRNETSVDDLFKTYKPEIVIHLASLVAGLYGNMENNYNFLIDNIKININLLDACKNYGVKRLINILSTCVFPEKTKYNNLTYPLSSDQILNGPPHESNIGYAYSKRILYIASNLLSKINDNLEIVNLIPTNLYGEYDNYNLQKSHVIPGLIHKIYLAKDNDTDLHIMGSGMARRQFVYTNDFAKIILNFVSIPLEKTFNSIIVCPGKEDEITIKELVNKLVAIMKYNGKIIYNNEYADGQNIKTTDSAELLQYIPDFKFTKLDEGLENTINYFIENFNNIRK